MLHTMQVRVVVIYNPDNDKPGANRVRGVHKAYYFCPSMLIARGIPDIEAYIKTEIQKDIDKYLEQNPEYKAFQYRISHPSDLATQYIS